MFNERRMTSSQPFGSRLSVGLEEGSADAASAGSEPRARFGKAFTGTEVPGQDRHPGTARISCLHVLSLLLSLVPVWAWPQGPAAAEGRAGTGQAWPRAWPQAHFPAPGHLAQGGCTILRRESTRQPLPCHGLWSRGTKPGLSWGQPGRAYEPLHPALMEWFTAAEMGFQMQKVELGPQKIPVPCWRC